MYFNVVNDTGPIGRRTIVAANVEKDRADFSAFLIQGVKLTNVTVAVSSGASSTATAAVVSANGLYVVWTITAAAVPESFTLTITITTNDGQTLQYTVSYQVIPLLEA